MELLKDNNDKDTNEISEEQVVQYLRNHPGFFLKRDDLLLELKLSHPSGKAVSLLERQVTLLRERNMDVRGRLNNLLENAADNDNLLDNTQQLVLSLIEAQGADAIVNALTRSLRSDFNMDYASVVLFANPEQYRSLVSRVVQVDDAYASIPSLLKSNQATCGVLREEELRFLFGDGSDQVGSAAVIPLHHEKPLGVMAIGSRDAHYFRSDMGTVFLDYVAAVLNRLLPRHLK